MFYCSLENFVKVKLLTGTAEGVGLVVLKAYHFFAWVNLVQDFRIYDRCMINDVTAHPNASLWWPDILACHFKIVSLVPA